MDLDDILEEEITDNELECNDECLEYNNRDIEGAYIETNKEYTEEREIDETLEALFLNKLTLEQPLIFKKDIKNAFSAERDYLNSKEYHDKFEKLPVNRDVQQALYEQTGRLLNFVDGKSEEHLLAINGRTGQFIVDNFTREGETLHTGFSDEELNKVNECRDSIIIVHNHSLNGRPSYKDLLAYLESPKIKISLIACHDGTLYGIYEVKPEIKALYDDFYKDVKLMGVHDEDAKILATSRLYDLNNSLNDKRKIFTVKNL